MKQKFIRIAYLYSKCTECRINTIYKYICTLKVWPVWIDQTICHFDQTWQWPVAILIMIRSILTPIRLNKVEHSILIWHTPTLLLIREEIKSNNYNNLLISQGLVNLHPDIMYIVHVQCNNIAKQDQMFQNKCN